MIHIATVHWKTDKWIKIQSRYFRKFIKDEYRVYAFLNDIEGDYSSYFHYISREDIKSHAVKLNLLGDIIKYASNNDDDIIIFIDGDAIPVDFMDDFLQAKIKQHKLLAVQRLENGGDIQPHPSFCATTVGLWKQLNGDWKSGYKWLNNKNESVTDVGGNLLQIVNNSNIDWYPLLRSNRFNIHPLFYAIYDNLIYHQGGGFRGEIGGRVMKNFLKNKLLAKRPDLRILKNALPRVFEKYIYPAVHYRLHRKLMKVHKELDELIFERICNNDQWEYLDIENLAEPKDAEWFYNNYPSLITSIKHINQIQEK